MKTIVLNGLFANKYINQSFEGKTTVQWLFEKAVHSGFQKVILLNNGLIEQVPEEVVDLEITDKTNANVMRVLINETAKSSLVVVMDAGSPYFDNEFINTMIKRHDSYVADYTYCIGYPRGLMPEIISNACLSNLLHLCKEEENLQEDFLFSIISKDINAFDIETFIATHDLRLLRIRFGFNNNSDAVFMKKMLTLISPLESSYEEIIKLLLDKKEILYTLPAAAYFNLHNKTDTNPIYLPQEDSSNEEVNFDQFKIIINQCAKLNSDMVCLFAGHGEPLLHSKIKECVEAVCENGMKLIIETSGLLLDANLIDCFVRYSHLITVVLRIDACNSEIYSLIHPQGDFSLVNEQYEKLLSQGIKVYKQFIRMNENEKDLEHAVLSKQMDSLLIKKYSTYCGRLPDRKVVDLSPIERFPCYHLRRELCFDVDLQQRLCVHSITKFSKADDGVLSTAYSEEFSAQCNGEYKQECLDCDDYYIFNF